MLTRSHSLLEAQAKTFDLVIIGGGITAAGIAQNAASRGLSVLLLEKGDFASGTSSKTTKLIHGGLRYLSQWQFTLTRTLCEERERMKRLAPHLVRDCSFILPFTRGSFFNNIKVSAGITLYDLLTITAGRTGSHRYLSSKGLLELAPSINGSTVTGGIEFHDAVTDDTRLVLSVLKSACDHGAIAINYVQAIGFELENGKISAVQCHDRLSGKDLRISCKSCVNATGAWSDQVRNLLPDDTHGKLIAPSKGTHIIVPQSAFDTGTALFLPAPDGRFVFVVPWHRAVMIGTTDTFYSGDIDRPLASKDEIDYLLSVVNRYSATNKLNRSDVVGSFAGLRPLVNTGESKFSAQPGKSTQTGSMSRGHLIFESNGKLINACGGKLTSYRLIAEEVVSRVTAAHPSLSCTVSSTDKIMLGGWDSQEQFLMISAAVAARARRLTLDPATIEHLISNYGADADAVLDILEKNPDLGKRICVDFPPILAEVPFCVEKEMAVSLEDILFRRVRLGILNHAQAIAAAPVVARMMQRLLHWDERRMRMELESIETEIPDELYSSAVKR